MSKVANYLNEHIAGEVITNSAVLKAFSHDASVLSMTPEMVVYPRSTNDIRKIARFSWQLAEKGHVLAITPRGGGTDQTGAAIGSGVIVNTTAHLTSIFELDTKQKLIRLQPGVTFGALNSALLLHGLHIPSYPASGNYSTVGGAIANNASGILSGKYGDTKAWVSQLEVVLASGDVLQTGRISKRELNRKKGLQTFEGEIYRGIDSLVTDNQELIEGTIASDVRDNSGYGGIADVKRKDGSMDLTPLFVGSQGTLGVISEVIMKSEFCNSQVMVGAAAFHSYDGARDAVDTLFDLEPSILEVIDARLFASALERGKKYAFYDQALEQGDVGAVVIFAFDEFSERARRKKAKKVTKLFKDKVVALEIEEDHDEAQTLLALREVSALALLPDEKEASAPAIIDGAYIPFQRFEDFASAVDALAKKHGIEMPLYGHGLESIFYTRPILHLRKVGDKQKIFKLLDEYTTLVSAHGGHIIGEAGEGRLKASFAAKQYDADVAELFSAIRTIFDPLGTLNPGVKQSADLKQLVSQLRTDFDTADFAGKAYFN